MFDSDATVGFGNRVVLLGEVNVAAVAAAADDEEAAAAAAPVFERALMSTPMQLRREISHNRKLY